MKSAFRIQNRSAALALLLCLLPGLLAAQTLRMAAVRGLPFPEGMRGAAAGAGVSVVVGEAGSIYSSSNGTSWTRHETPARADLQGVAWTGSVFCIVGDAGTILTSPDGTVWTPRTSGTGICLAAAAAGAGKIVAAGDAGKVLTSTDGVAWAAVSAPVSDRINGLACGAGIFVAVTEAGGILTSPDATAWTAQASSASGALSSVAFASGLFVAAGAGGEILTSPDGVAWTVRRSGQSERLWCVAAVGGGFLAVGSGGTVVQSADGLSWSAQSLAGSPLLRAVAQGGFGIFAVSESGALWTSGDGSAWTQASSGSGAALSAVAAGGASDPFVAVGAGGTILTSPDGFRWTSEVAPTGADLEGIAFGAAKFVAVGAGGSIFTSASGSSWTAATSATTDSLHGVTYGPAGFVAVGHAGLVLHSADGTSWTSASVPSAKGDLLSVAHGNGLYVAVGQWGQIATSPDGIAWTLLPDEPTQKERWYDITGIAYSNGRFVTSTHFGTSLTSTDGATWTKRTAAMVPGFDFYGAVALPDRLVVFGDLGIIQTSPDGAAWTDQARSSGVRLRGGAFGGGTAVFVGENGAIVVTMRGISSQPQSVSVTEGQTGTLSVLADGVGPFTYQWYRGTSGDTSSPIVGATGSSLTIDPGVGGAAYWVRVTDGQGSFDSSAAAIIVQVGWTAYHDTITQADNAANVTTGNSTTGTTLVNFSTGAAIPGVTIKFSQTVGVSGALKTDAATGSPTLGGDAAAIFGGIIGFGTQVWDLGKNTGTATITISGLSAGKIYDLAIFATRDNYLSQTKFVLGGAASFTAAHSTGCLNIGGSPTGTEVAIATGDGSTVAGRVARWSDLITSGTTLTVTVTSPDPVNNSCLLPQAIRISETTEAPVIVAGPASAEAPAGSSLTLTSSVLGTGVTYQWYRRDLEGNVSAVASATSAALNLPNVSESAQYFVRASASGGSVDSSASTVIVQRTYDQWAAIKGLPPSADADDSDGDGLPNLVEYALGTNPSAQTPGPAFVIDGSNRLSLTFRASKEIGGVTMIPETSATLTEGSWTSPELEQLPDENFATESWVASVPLTSARTFLRLRVTRP